MKINPNEYLKEIAALIAERLDLKNVTYSEEYNYATIRGLTRHNFALVIKWMMKEEVLRLQIMANGLANKDLPLEETFQYLPDFSEFRKSTSTRLQYEYRSADVDALVEQAEALKMFVDNNDLGASKVKDATLGVLFAGTQFDRLKERGATMSPMFCALVAQAAGMNVLQMQAEYYVDAGEIDGVEFDSQGRVISIYECQSGIHKGLPLDEDHLSKALGNYLYDREIIGTVRKVVILAGEYDEATLNLLKERSYELSRREQSIELVVLKTVRENNIIAVERLPL
jgi:hypothetical protein